MIDLEVRSRESGLSILHGLRRPCAGTFPISAVKIAQGLTQTLDTETQNSTKSPFGDLMRCGLWPHLLLFILSDNNKKFN